MDGEDSSRPTIVLLHGEGGSQLSWPVEIRRLTGYRVLALDLPGHGKSVGIAFQNMEENTRIVGDFLRHLGVFSVALVGHSLGAAIAVDFAMKNPDQTQALALLSASARLSIPPEIFHAVADPDTYHVGLSRMKQLFFSPTTSLSSRTQILQLLERQRSTILYSDFLAASKVHIDLERNMPHCPCLAICGREDLITPSSLARRLSAAFEISDFREIPSAGHMLMLEQPSVAASEIKRFLSKLSSLDHYGNEKNFYDKLDLARPFVVQ